MRYFHRTSLAPDAVLAVAERHFGGQLSAAETAQRSRSYGGTIGNVTIDVAAEGGHYTRVTVTTDQVGESEIDKLAKRFLGMVHREAEPTHVVRGAY
jgi:hypothetical protein